MKYLEGNPNKNAIAHSNIAFRTKALKEQVDSWLDKEFPFSSDMLAITSGMEP